MDLRRLDNKMDMIMVDLVDTLIGWMEGRIIVEKDSKDKRSLVSIFL